MSGSGSGSGVGITLAPRRSSKPLPELVPFTANSASLYLRQTENLWLCPNLTRHSGEGEGGEGGREGGREDVC